MVRQRFNLGLAIFLVISVIKIMSLFKIRSVIRSTTSLLTTLIVVVVMSGCVGGVNSAINRTENYAYAWPNIKFQSNHKILVSAIDERAYVLSGKKDLNFVGLMRGGFGNPFDMYTESGAPLSDDLVQAITSGLKNGGLSATENKLKHDLSRQELIESLKLDTSAKKVLLKFKEWKSDTYSASRFLFELTLEIYDFDGALIVSITEKNINKDNTSSVSPMDSAREALSLIFNNELVSNALK